MRISALLVFIPFAMPSDAGAQLPRFQLQPGDFAVGGQTTDDRYALSRVEGARRLPNGYVVIADHYAQGLRLYSEAGEFVARAGGPGGGPSEFQSIRGLGNCEPGAVVAFDVQWTLKVFDYALEFVESRGSRVSGWPGGPYQLACNESATVVATGWGDPDAQQQVGLFQATAPVVLVRAGEVIHDFGERLSSERVGFPPDPRGQSDRHYAGAASGPHPFGRQTSVAIGDTRVYLGDGAAFSVEVYDLRGGPLETIHWEGGDRSVLDEHVAAFVEERVAAAPPERRPALRRSLEALPRVEQFPAFDALMVDRIGRLWVRSFRRPGENHYFWTVFGESGILVGALPLPTTVELLEAGAGYVLTVHKDELDVETVRLSVLTGPT